MSEQGTSPATDEASARRLRRAELLVERQRAADRRRQRGFRLRLPTSKPLVFEPADERGGATTSSR